ncbi:hypothetical protein A9D14_18630 (plasmid) [Croceicoccus marinus]|uniref:Uncharacterized protein n=1 Tax=Croceicoccus marinus TaxID=450378 RepID=A0A217EYZ9_9SPHN|nr:hypothetical protein A9D14_18630 [Croceicoccus marinus]
MFRFGDQIAINGTGGAALRLSRTAPDEANLRGLQMREFKLGARYGWRDRSRQQVLPSNMSREGECCGIPDV